MENSESLIDKIKAEKVKPIPKWKFSIKEKFISIIFIIALLFGGLSFSIILFAIQQLDFSLITHMTHSWLEFSLAILPFLWIILLVLFLVFAMLGIKNSKSGYKFSLSKLFLFNTSFSILIGTFFFISGGAGWLENKFAVNVASYESIQEKKEKMWNIPQEGYLAGTIKNINPIEFELESFQGKNWIINYENANKPGFMVLENGVEIKIIGKIISDNKFRADEIRPWGGSGRFRNSKGR
ncbi:MAG: hypothetical protein C0598_06785 [Marinilabiliales bacterium]|nr:MAG: hypothetical protein C0598_06785 [Marinilabiliales bacterium]